LRDRLAAQRTRCALFDTAAFARALEAAFATMARRHAAGEAPASFAVPPS
jgi:predicted O-linked N-acetylglucosamine transferase (SPINDLY family)